MNVVLLLRKKPIFQLLDFFLTLKMTLSMTQNGNHDMGR